MEYAYLFLKLFSTFYFLQMLLQLLNYVLDFQYEPEHPLQAVAQKEPGLVPYGSGGRDRTATPQM